VPTLLQIVVGIWVLLELNESQRMALMGERLLATMLFAVAVLVALRLMHLSAAIALGERRSRQLVSAIVTMVVTTLLMSATLHISSQREELNLGVQAPLTE
jgi:hypothetical protein